MGLSVEFIVYSPVNPQHARFQMFIVTFQEHDEVTAHSKPSNSYSKSFPLRGLSMLVSAFQEIAASSKRSRPLCRSISTKSERSLLGEGSSCFWALGAILLMLI